MFLDACDLFAEKVWCLMHLFHLFLVSGCSVLPMVNGCDLFAVVSILYVHENV
jgi:hypothetical protein